MAFLLCGTKSDLKMDLFRQKIEQPNNLLPQDGIAKYHGVVAALHDADHYFE